MHDQGSDCQGGVEAASDLTEAEMIEVMDEIMGGEATPAQVAAFITALRMKGETVAEITGAARVMRDRATPIRVGRVLDLDRDEINLDRETILDTCGTGGNGTRSFNISTTVAFVVAACGVKVAKHGNRSVSSTCGSADVLEALGVNLARHPGAGRGVHPRGRHRLPLRPGPARGDEARHRPAPRDRHPHHLQHPRPADQPGQGRSPGARCLP